MLEPENRQDSAHKMHLAIQQCNALERPSPKLVFCSVQVLEGPMMQRLMQNNTDLAQKLLLGVVKHTNQKRKADEVL